MATPRKIFDPVIYVTHTSGVYEVESQTYPGRLSYVVDLRDPAWPTCSCPAFATYDGPCKHLKAVREFEGELLAARAWADFWNEPLPARFTRMIPATAAVPTAA